MGTHATELIELRAARWAAVSVALLVAQLVASKAVRDGLFLAQFPAAELPKAMLLSALLALVVAWGTSRGLWRAGPRRVVQGLALASALLFLLEWLLAPSAGRAAAAMLYLHVAALGASAVSGLWSIVNERFDPRRAKTVVSRIAAGGTIGGLLGGVLAERTSALLDTRSMLLALACLNVMISLSITRIPQATRPLESSASAPTAEPAWSRYICRIAGLITAMGVASAVLDYVFKAKAALVFDSAEALTGFFAIFYTITGLLTFLLQAVAGGALLRRIGLGGALLLLPAAVLAAASFAAVNARFASILVAKAVEQILGNSVFRSGYELLYAPLAEDRKRRAKVLVDVGADRAGEILGSSAVLVSILFVPDAPAGLLLTIALMAALVAVFAARSLQRGYVDQLASSLRSRSVLLESLDLSDKTTLDTVSRTFGAVDRHTLLAQIEQLRGARSASGRSEAPPAPVPRAAATGDVGGRLAVQAEHRMATSIDDTVAETTRGYGLLKGGERTRRSKEPEPRAELAATDQRLLTKLSALLSPDPDEVLRALRAPPLDDRLVPQVVRLLGQKTLAAAARDALSVDEGRSAGAIADAMLDTSLPPRARREIPAILANWPSPRAAAALVEGLNQECREVRWASAEALSAIVQRAPALRPPRRQVEAHVLAALATSSVDPRRRSRDARATRRYVFALLGILHDPSAMATARRALESGDERLRGTALEYLDNLLSGRLRDAVLRAFESTVDVVSRPEGPASRDENSLQGLPGGPRSTRGRRELLDDLNRSLAQLPQDASAHALEDDVAGEDD